MYLCLTPNLLHFLPYLGALYAVCPTFMKSISEAVLLSWIQICQIRRSVLQLSACWIFKGLVFQYLCPWVLITKGWTVTNWFSLSMYNQTFNTLTRIEVIWSNEPIWNMYNTMLLVCHNLNRKRSNETLLGPKIWISDLQDRRWAVSSSIKIAKLFNIYFFNLNS
jgi:hypothetical protein